MVNEFGTKGLLDPPHGGWRGSFVRQSIELPDNFVNTYGPKIQKINPPAPESIDFSLKGSYSDYNWELFYHIPISIALRFSQNQQFEQAQKWFHFIFEPTEVVEDNDNPDPRRFWKIKPFYTYQKNHDLEELMKESDLT